MNRKKITALLLVFILICSLLSAAGCSKSDEQTSDNKTPESSEKTEETNSVNNEKGYYTAEDYLADPTLFKPVWADEWQPPEELLDFEEKYKSFFEPDGRLMIIAHRGDNDIYYPENSIEAILSAIMAGCDIIEVDVQMTKDGVPVIMHDMLARTTNVSDVRKKGFVNVPASDDVSQWTLEELRHLRLVMESETGNTATNCVIPTLEEVVMVCANRVFLTLDYSPSTYNFNWETDFLPLVEKYNAYRTLLVPNGYFAQFGMDYVEQVIANIEKESGYKAPLFCPVDASTVDMGIKMLNEHGWTKFLKFGDYVEGLGEQVVQYSGDYRVSVNFMWDPYQTFELCKSWHEKGINTMFVNNYMPLVQYIAELYFSE